MIQKARVIYLHALTPVHSGTGQTAAVIDLPVARDRTTDAPIIPGSSVKGVLRDVLQTTDNNANIEAVFGKADEAGALCIGDQQVLLFPARSFFGTFAWVTAPLPLARFRRDLRAFGLTTPFPDVPEEPVEDAIHLTEGSALRPTQDERVYLEDLGLNASGTDVSALANSLAGALFDNEEESGIFKKRFAVVPNKVFYFLCKTATEVTARVILKDDTKTVKRGGLWYEEAVPAETIFWGAALIEGRRGAADAMTFLESLNGKMVQFGGKSTTGRGQCRVRVTS